MIQRRIDSREQGAATVEYVGIAFVVLALILVIGAMTMSGSGIASAIACKVGEVLGAASCTAEEEHSVVPQPGDVVVSRDDERHSAKGTGAGNIGVVEAGLSVTDGGTQSYQRNADGSGSITIGESWAGSAHGSVGKDIDSGSAEVALQAKLEGEVQYNTDQVYNCRYGAAEGERDCEEFRQQWSRQLAAKADQGVADMLNEDDTIDENPDEIRESWQGRIAITGEAGVEVEETKAGEVNLSASGKIEGGTRWDSTYGVDENGEKGQKKGYSQTYFYSLGGGANASVKLMEEEFNSSGIEIAGSAGVKVSGDVGVETKYEWDENGNLSKVTFTTTSNVQGGAQADVGAEGEDKTGADTSPAGGHLDVQGGQAVETTVAIDMASLTDAERATVEQYVGSFQGYSPILPAAAYNPSSPAAPDDALGTVIHENATVTRSVYSTRTASEENTLDAWFLSYTTSSEYQNRTLVSQQYLAEPGADGRRQYVDTPGVNVP
ncbi:MAG: hypothetical protein Q4C85_04245 [Actinomyces sp.]|uniref:hypothetical protein n=1 Tax=Actinomyces sp. TaxID=29317 RepID=UPI0026DD9336|nr:hypothetical protein [Actinomyces sp.]MDO4242959.1 hypothetical protein [Actinomyces sp.]